MINTESIYAALFELVSKAEGFKFSSRRLLDFDSVPDIKKPALFQIQVNQQEEQTRIKPSKYTLSAHIWIYAKKIPNHDTITSSALNTLIDSVRAILKPSDGESVQVLGLPNVSHCFINGTILVAEGVEDGQAIAVIPIDILATD